MSFSLHFFPFERFKTIFLKQVFQCRVIQWFVYYETNFHVRKQIKNGRVKRQRIILADSFFGGGRGGIIFLTIVNQLFKPSDIYVFYHCRATLSRRYLTFEDSSSTVRKEGKAVRVEIRWSFKISWKIIRKRYRVISQSVHFWCYSFQSKFVGVFSIWKAETRIVTLIYACFKEILLDMIKLRGN